MGQKKLGTTALGLFSPFPIVFFGYLFDPPFVFFSLVFGFSFRTVWGLCFRD